MTAASFSIPAIRALPPTPWRQAGFWIAMLIAALMYLNAVLLSIQPGVYNLAVRMLGNRDDAADAAQEILMKVVTHLSSFRGDAAFTTWVFQIARNHLLTASTRSRESPEVSLDAIAERLQTGLDFAAAYRQRLARTRAVLDPFVQRTCGLANSEAACRCERQLPAIKHLRAHPEYRAPESMIGATRAVLRSAGYWDGKGGRSLQ